ncbi:hypothetical protein HPB52_021220 [Rhipicephalus sanguineus]|uniref:Tick transposon n=1 Tax=Rhipicephalus sanguineus TaxID=34632 RepID=A0A9D4Q2Z8_RHISA|nr:hypothetical protein HPB52_021220 [Rhipicephalus sanguineus]
MGANGIVHEVDGPFLGSRHDAEVCAETSACPADETIDHILLQCPGYDDHRRRLFGAFSRLGLPHLCLDELLFPSAQHSKVLQAFHALLDFFGDADLFTRL